MGLTPAQARVLNEQKPPRRVTLTESGALMCHATIPNIELTAGSTFGITHLNVSGGNKDGMTVELRIATGSSTVTILETGNIKTTSTSLALAADDNAKFRYRASDSKWYQISTTNH